MTKSIQKSYFEYSLKTAFKNVPRIAQTYKTKRTALARETHDQLIAMYEISGILSQEVDRLETLIQDIVSTLDMIEFFQDEISLTNFSQDLIKKILKEHQSGQKKVTNNVGSFA